MEIKIYRSEGHMVHMAVSRLRAGVDKPHPVIGVVREKSLKTVPIVKQLIKEVFERYLFSMDVLSWGFGAGRSLHSTRRCQTSPQTGRMLPASLLHSRKAERRSSTVYVSRGIVLIDVCILDFPPVYACGWTL